MNLRRTLVFFLFLSGTLIVPALAEAHLRAGTSKVDITPAEPVQMAGYSSRTDLSTGIHDRLFVRRQKRPS